MKKNLKLVLAILTISILTATLFIGCSAKLTNEDAYAPLKSACEKTLNANQYYSRLLEGNYEYYLNIWPDKEKTADINETMCKFTIADYSNILQTKYSYSYYGSSLPASVKKEKNAQISDYKTYYFFQKEVEKDGKKEIQMFKNDTVTYEQYLAMDKIKNITKEAIVDTVSGINETNSTMVSVVKTGKAVEYVLKVNAKCNTLDSSKDLYACLSNDDSLGVIIRVLDGKLAKISVTKLTSNGNVDENSTAVFSYFISYVGPNLKYFGESAMPHYDEYETAEIV